MERGGVRVRVSNCVNVWVVKGVCQKERGRERNTHCVRGLVRLSTRVGGQVGEWMREWVNVRVSVRASEQVGV